MLGMGWGDDMVVSQVSGELALKLTLGGTSYRNGTVVDFNHEN